MQQTQISHCTHWLELFSTLTSSLLLFITKQLDQLNHEANASSPEPGKTLQVPSVSSEFL